MAGPNIDIGEIAKDGHKYELSVSNESQEDAVVRRNKDIEDAKMKRTMTLSLFFFSLTLVAFLFVGCAYNFMNGSPDDKKWTASILSAMMSGLVGYLVGQGKK